MAHLDSDLFEQLFKEHGYVPKLTDTDAVRMIADILAANNTAYRQMLSGLGKPETKVQKTDFYTRMREVVNTKFGVKFTPFVPPELGRTFRDAMQTHDEELAAKFVAEAATLYHSAPSDFDRFAQAAGYREAE